MAFCGKQNRDYAACPTNAVNFHVTHYIKRNYRQFSCVHSHVKAGL
jgi:hypothetical protein